jgi:hypothetical protein
VLLDGAFFVAKALKFLWGNFLIALYSKVRVFFPEIKYRNQINWYSHLSGVIKSVALKLVTFCFSSILSLLCTYNRTYLHGNVQGSLITSSVLLLTVEPVTNRSWHPFVPFAAHVQQMAVITEDDSHYGSGCARNGEKMNI